MPIKYKVVKNFLPTVLFEDLKRDYDESLMKDEWNMYDNPLEMKTSRNIISHLSSIKRLMSILNSEQFIKELRDYFNIEEEIEVDDDMYGAGFHNHIRGGHLCLHLDYEINPVSFKKRFINLILYLNDDWDETYNGATELWSDDCKKCDKLVYPESNKALFFRTDGSSWHGVTTPVSCPKTISRKTIAIYFVSKQKHEIKQEHRTKAHFYHPNYLDLCEIRKTRRLTDSDFKLLHNFKS